MFLSNQYLLFLGGTANHIIGMNINMLQPSSKDGFWSHPTSSCFALCCFYRIAYHVSGQGSINILSFRDRSLMSCILCINMNRIIISQSSLFVRKMVCVSVKMCAEEETCSITYENGFQKWKKKCMILLGLKGNRNKLLYVIYYK